MSEGRQIGIDLGSEPASADSTANSTVSDDAQASTPPKPALEKRKVTIAGKERELTFDEAVRLASKAEGSEARLREAAEIRKQSQEESAYARDLLGALESPAHLRELAFRYSQATGKKVDIYAVAEQLVDEKQRYSQMTPEQRALVDAQYERHQLLEQKRALEEKVRAAEEREKQEEFAEAAEQEYEHWNKRLTAALKAGGLPASPYALQRIATYTLAALEQGLEIDDADIVASVKEELEGEKYMPFNDLEGQALLSAMGDSLVSRVRKALTAQVSNPVVQRRSNGKSQPRQEKSEERSTYWSGSLDDWRRSLGGKR